MEIKALFQTGMAVACLAFCLTACEEDQTLRGVAPSAIGNIQMETQDIRPGQRLTASIAVPVGGENITKVSYLWGESGVPADSVVNGVAYHSFAAGEEAGTYRLKFTARYLFAGPNAQGNMSEDLVAQLDYTVVPGDIFGSKWGDTQAKTLEVYSGLAEDTSRPGTYFGVFKEPLNNVGATTINRFFLFGDGGLAKITEFETYSSDEARAYLSKLGIIRDSAIKKLGMNGVRSYYVAEDDPAGTPIEFDADLPFAEWEDAIGEKLQNGEISVYSELQDGTTSMLISVFPTGNGDGEVYFTRDYTPLK